MVKLIPAGCVRRVLQVYPADGERKGGLLGWSKGGAELFIGYSEMEVLYGMEWSNFAAYIILSRLIINDAMKTT